MRSRIILIDAFLLATTTPPLVTSGCRSCGPEPACKFADLLAACDSTVGCALSGAAKLEPGGDLLDPTAVQTTYTFTSVALPPNSSVTVPVVDDAATLTALPLLDISVYFASGEADQVTVFVDGQSWSACVPIISTTFMSEEWKCPLPSPAQTIELQVVDASVQASVQLTEPTCTGQTTFCGE